MAVCSSSLESPVRSWASTTTRPLVSSSPTLTTLCVSGWSETSAGFSTLHAPTMVRSLTCSPACSSSSNKPFPLIVNNPAMSFSITGGNPALGSVVGTTCTTDWITIPCATNSNSPTQTGTPAVCVDRICGMVFNSATTASGMPNVPVNSKFGSRIKWKK